MILSCSTCFTLCEIKSEAKTNAALEITMATLFGRYSAFYSGVTVHHQIVKGE